ncbi:receptor-like protein 41 [Carex rostrata]
MVPFALLSLFLLFSFSTKNSTLTQAQCLPDQRDALIQLKQGFNTTKLHSWNASTDCCIWDGIECDKQIGMVTAINLESRYISGEINPALFNLSSLQYLNLAGNNFYNLTIPQIGFERLANLTHLDLSYSGFIGQVPIGISSLTNLISLDLSSNYLNLHGTGLKTLLSNLTKLQLLSLDWVDISINGSEWGKAVFQVGPTLQELSMIYCGLSGNFPDGIFHLTNLTELDLSDNIMLSGQLPDSIGNLQNLSILDLENCSLYGVIPPSITNITRLIDLILGFNRLTGTIPMSFFTHPSLQFLDLANNQLSGYLPEFSNGSLTLANIYFDGNNLQGLVPISLFKLPQLNGLGLSSNNFVGTLNLDVILNSIKDNKNLESLILSNNKFSIIEGKNHNESFYASFPQMQCIQLASLHLTKFPSFLRYQTNIENLDLSNNKIGGVIPNWLCSKTSIFVLNLSHNFFTKIEDDAHLTFSDSLENFDFSSNRISGPVPLLPPGITFADFSSNYFSWPAYFRSIPIYLSLSKNSLTGEIPLSICNVTLPKVLDPGLPRGLDLSFNNLTGTIPPCLLEDAEFRQVLNLQSNNLSGPLPRNINQGCKLRTINLSGNRIHGSLPQSLLNCDTLVVLDLGNNQIVDRFPFWLGTLRNLRALVLRSNQFYGPISNMEVKTKTNNSFFPTLKVLDVSSNHFSGIISKTFFENLMAMVSNSDSDIFTGYLGYYYHNSITVLWKGQEMEINKSLTIFSSLDLSENGFSGEIPGEIGQLKSLDVLNLSHNALIGPIPSELGNLNQLQSLDLSCNQLSGHIPQELTSLTFLSALNLSYNNMVGEIPQGHQFSTFPNDSYLGNPGLCGSPLSIQCATTPYIDGFNKDLPSKSSTDIIELSISIGLGLGVGFASVICALVSWDNGREQFNFIVDRFYFQHIPWIVLHLRFAIGRE